MPFMRDSLSLTHSACTPARHVAWWIACAFLVSLHLISPMLSVVAVAEMSTPRVVALGDLHGDLDNTLIILRAAGLIVTDEPIGMVSDVKENAQSARWVGGSTVLIQVGDVMDRGPNTWELLDLFHDLTAQAQAAGGDVIMLYGNHEIMNLAGQFSYVHPQETLGNNILERIQILASGGSRYAEYLRAERKTAHVIHNTLFVHAGVIPIWASLGIDGINQRVRDAVMANDWNHPILDVTGPLWSRSLVNEAVNGACQTLLDVLAVLDLKRMVVGHTPEQSGEIGEYCEGKLYVIDTMLSRWMRSEGTARVVEKYVRALSLRPVSGEEVVNLAASQSQLQDIPPEYLGLDPRGGNTSEDEMDIMDKLIFTPDQPEFVDVELEELGIPSNLVEPGTDESSNVNESSPDTLHDFFKTNNDLLQEVNNLLREFERIKGHVPLKPALDDEPDAPEEL